MNQKESQRKKILAKRDSLSEEEIEKKSSQIKQKLFKQAELETADRIMLFVSFGSEVRTEAMIKTLLAEEKEVVVPVIDDEEKELVLSRLTDYDHELELGSYGILEPAPEYQRWVEPESLDLIVAPGVAFDEEKNRLGYGGGYYDRLLAKTRPGISIIALGFNLQIVDEVITDEHDLPVTKIITEQRMID
jgi:5-formyltetrahydrofolate cyclo-ligase